MKSFLLLLFGVALTAASLAQLRVKKGETVELNFPDAEKIKRTVAAGTQIFSFAGQNSGKFVDEKTGKSVDSSDLEVKNGILYLKNFGEADEGSYQKEPNLIMKKIDENNFSAVLGPVLEIQIEK